MSMDFDDREPTRSSNDSPLFAATPVWERGRKRRGLAARRPPEPRSIEPADEPPMTLDRPAPGPNATVTNTTFAAEDDPLAAPIARGAPMRTSRARSSNGAAPMALIVGGMVAVAALAGAGWYAMRGHEGVPEITPGASQVATAPLPPPVPTEPAAAPAEVAANTPPPVEHPQSEAAPARARVIPAARHAARASQAPSAESSSANASAHAALPDGPQPYTSLNPQATPVNPAAPPPPVQQTAPSAPESIPATPPVSPPQSAPNPPTPPDTQATPPTKN